MTDLGWIGNMDAEQMARDILSPCSYHGCRECSRRWLEGETDG